MLTQGDQKSRDVMENGRRQINTFSHLLFQGEIWGGKMFAKLTKLYILLKAAYIESANFCSVIQKFAKRFDLLSTSPP